MAVKAYWLDDFKELVVVEIPGASLYLNTDQLESFAGQLDTWRRGDDHRLRDLDDDDNFIFLPSLRGGSCVPGYEEKPHHIMHDNEVFIEIDDTSAEALVPLLNQCLVERVENNVG
jgi:hypothetical protein